MAHDIACFTFQVQQAGKRADTKRNTTLKAHPHAPVSHATVWHGYYHLVCKHIKKSWSTNCCAQHLTSLTNWKTRRKVSENSATKKHIQCTFIEKEHLGFLWFEIILYKQRLIELFGSYVSLKKYMAHDIACFTFQVQQAGKRPTHKPSLASASVRHKQAFSMCMTTPLGIIGGSSLLKSVYFQGFESRTVQTRFDPQKEYSPPHLINKQAIVQAMYDSGVRHVIAFGSVGSLDPEKYPFGTLLVADDFFNPSEIITVFNDARAHFVPEMRTPYREKVFSVVKQQHDKVVDGGTYAQTLGPRFETKSEIRFLKSFADVVGEPFRPLNIVLTSSGMTAAHEFILCSELKIEYALICMIDNVANGLATKTLTLEEVRNGSTELIDQNFQFHQGVALNQQTVEGVVSLLLQKREELRK
ncbi:methylthioadenosine phosphorylase [Planoprotostelium fungivorum]|uniref:Methylthioadenosine phosphorylase n=1 Tax=Planoprotostelium fungivorum TaxID=1890364 RepID=A0A2P6MTB8_9EUKA|nr:methylthioadenosine phosphorylase [Planoprotostelium fungivorum]